MSELISIQSVGLLQFAFSMLILKALPTYRKFIRRDRPPVSSAENIPSASAIVLMLAATDSHLQRLKFLHDVAPHSGRPRPTPAIPFQMQNSLSRKVEVLFENPSERKLRDELTELTVCRDAIVHAKVYEETRRYSRSGIDKIRYKIALGTSPNEKHRKHTMRRFPLTRRLRLNVIPTWVNYIDAVTCILVLNRALSTLETRYGNPYAVVGPLIGDGPEISSLFGRSRRAREPDRLQDWVRAFFDSLSSTHQKAIEKRLGPNFVTYLRGRY